MCVYVNTMAKVPVYTRDSELSLGTLCDSGCNKAAMLFIAIKLDLVLQI